MSQSVATSPHEACVALHHLNAPVDGVLDLLPRAMIAHKQLQVLWRVVGLVARTVMDGFARQQGPSEGLLHDVTVLEHFPNRLSFAGRNTEHDIAAFKVLCD